MSIAHISKNLDLIEEVKRASNVPLPLCDEYERMISGMISKTSNSDELQSHRIAIMRLLNQFNDNHIPDGSTLQSLRHQRMTLAEKMLGRVGRNVNINIPFYIGWGCNTFIGDGTYLNRNVSIYDDAPVFIGNNVRVAMDVCICTGTHQLDPFLREETGGSFALPIRIGDECWIGARATILPGVTIGRGSTVAAGAVVTSDVEPYCVVGGVPARVIRRLDTKN